MRDLKNLEQRIVAELRGFGPQFFTCGNYNQMHGHVLGALARVAVENDLNVAIDLPHRLEKPWPGKRKRLHARPDLTLYPRGKTNACGIVEYESVDINAGRLPYKRHLLVNWPPRIPGIASVLIAMTVPDKPVWKDSPKRTDLEEHQIQLMKEASAVDVSYTLFLIDSSRGVDLLRFKGGSLITHSSTGWY